MMGHLLKVRQWAKAMKPPGTAEEIEQARIMRCAKAAKRVFEGRQIRLWDEQGKAA